MIRTLDAEDLEALVPLLNMLDAIETGENWPLLDALLQVEAVRKHLRSKYYDRPQELKS